MLTIIAALARNGVIGVEGRLPWQVRDDLKRFKALTVGKTVLMGRKTWDSLGRPLPDRENWVLTRDPQFQASGARVFSSLAAALAAECKTELLIIGGADLYRQALPLADRMELTEIHADVTGDAAFPAFDPADWRELGRVQHAADERNEFPYSFVTYERIRR